MVSESVQTNGGLGYAPNGGPGYPHIGGPVYIHHSPRRSGHKEIRKINNGTIGRTFDIKINGSWGGLGSIEEGTSDDLTGMKSFEGLPLNCVRPISALYLMLANKFSI
jgi:hypothetical protein